MVDPLDRHHDDLLHASTSTNILKVLGNSGDEVVTTGFNGLATKKTVNGATIKSSNPSPLTSPALETDQPL
jgi:hypothetical protein